MATNPGMSDIAAELFGALVCGEIRIGYLPIVALADDGILGAEALLCRRHPVSGELDPAGCATAEEQSDDIVPLGNWMLEQACREAAGWPSGPAGTPRVVSVGVSAVQLADPGFLGAVQDAIVAAGLAADRLQLELAASVVLDATRVVLDELDAVVDLGVRVALGVGTGYADLGYLQHLPVDAIELAGPFLTHLAPAAAPAVGEHGDPIPGARTRVRGDRRRGPGAADPVLTETVIGLAHALGQTVTAVHVETRAQAARLRELGCDAAKGWPYHRPLTSEGLLAVLGR